MSSGGYDRVGAFAPPPQRCAPLVEALRENAVAVARGEGRRLRLVAALAAEVETAARTELGPRSAGPRPTR